MTTIPQCHRRTDKRTDGRTTRGRVRAGPSFMLGTLSTRIANLLCMILKAMTSGFPNALQNQTSASKRHCFTGRWLMTSISIYSADRRSTPGQPGQSDSTQVKAGNLPWQYRAPKTPFGCKNRGHNL